MREAHPTERAVGVDHYVSDCEGVGGRLRARPGDFRVREIERFEWESVDADPGSYPHVVFRATLAGWDTNDFARALSDRLGISRERVSWAGTKDKRAVSTQLFSIRAPDPDDAAGIDASAVGAVDLDEAEIEVLGRAGRAIRFGDLAGNAFTVVVHDTERPGRVDAITEQLRAFAAGEGVPGVGDGDGSAPDDPGSASVRGDADAGRSDEPTTVGVPNYFGGQRFGSLRPVTHEVGLEAVRGNWRGAVLAYVGRPHEREPGSTREARAFAEREAASGTPDWNAILDRLPRRLGFERAMVQRLVENDTRRREDFREALEAVPSNLQRLFVNAAQSYLFNRMLSARLERGLPFARAVAGDVVCFADRNSGALALPDPDRRQQVDEGRVETVDRHVARGRAFVTAPLVGTATEFSDGEPGEIERSVCEEAGLEPADFDLPCEFHSTGTRRGVLVRAALEVRQDPLTFEFSLPKGSYATVVLREFLKTDPVELG
jgi:tRNA pseudouridine13 synthase